MKIKRIYDPVSVDDGLRVLVDRLWPRGVRKDRARVDRWLKEIAPSDALRKWFGHDPKKWTEFQRKYRAELRQKSHLLEQLKNEAGKGAMTLLFAAKDAAHNNAAALKKLLK